MTTDCVVVRIENFNPIKSLNFQVYLLFYQGEKWEHVPTDQSIKCITAGGTRQVWCCGENGICYWRFGITATNPIGRLMIVTVSSRRTSRNYRIHFSGERWESVESMDGRFFEKIAIGNFVVWALESTGELFIRKESIPDIPASALWHKVKNFGRLNFSTFFVK